MEEEKMATEVQENTEENTVADAQESTEETEKETEKSFCVKCGAELLNDQVFCPKCGRKVGEKLAASTENKERAKPATGSNKNKVIVGVVVGVAAIAAVTVFVLLHGKAKGPDLQAIYDEYCSTSFASVALDGSYLSVDTNPSDLDDHTNYEAYNAIKKINEALGFPESVLYKMNQTRSLDGIQTYSNSELEVSWTYHPNRGLEVNYSLKD